MKQHNPLSDRQALASSYKDRADAIKAGRGFWNGRVICNDPEKCKEKRDKLMNLHDTYMNEHNYNNYGG